MYQLAIFDLDGTLLDTLADLRQGINYALGTQGFAPRSMAEVRAFVGNGIWKLVERAVPAGTSEAQMDAVYEAFNPYYAKHCADLTVPYDGILPLLQKLQAQGVVCALVSNKPDYAVQTLAAQYFPGLLAASAGAKDGVRKKPAPDSVFAVIHQLRAEGLRAVYIGDSEVDLQTAQNAALPCISVSWGFRDRDVLVGAGAETICDDMDALYVFFLLRQPRAAQIPDHGMHARLRHVQLPGDVHAPRARLVLAQLEQDQQIFDCRRGQRLGCIRHLEPPVLRRESGRGVLVVFFVLLVSHL